MAKSGNASKDLRPMVQREPPSGTDTPAPTFRTYSRNDRILNVGLSGGVLNAATIGKWNEVEGINEGHVEQKHQGEAD